MDSPALNRIADALERINPVKPDALALDKADAYIWHADSLQCVPLEKTAHLALDLLKGVDHVKNILLQNTKQFAEGFSANNALLWGARGMGKSSLIKAIHAQLNEEKPQSLCLIEIHREELNSLPLLLSLIANSNRRIILFCDDLSFDDTDQSYKSLKAVLDGGIQGRPEHVLFYASSNRRHLMPRDMIENEQSNAIHPDEVVHEKVSLSDRFGLWLGFHVCDQTTFFSIIESYIEHFNIPISTEAWKAEAIEWSQTRGGRSGRIAWQFINDVAGRLGHPLKID
ncbi:MAG: ATP-binding protein [Rickettsiales bacterium]|nr:ATP-binding protein [Rickettsiales bacterium]